MTPTFGVLQFPGSCDERDALAACRRVGEARLVWHEETDLEGIDAIVIPGGFSYGDYLRTGAIARFSPVMSAVADFAADGGPVLGICNGFQVLCEARMLPGALLPNQGMRFVCRQVELEVVNPATAFTGRFARGQTLSIPAKHAGGRFHASAVELQRLEGSGQIVLRYRPGHDPNGSAGSVAGVTNSDGNVMGLMPHPEHAIDLLFGSEDGLAIFRSIADHVEAGHAGRVAAAGR